MAVQRFSLEVEKAIHDMVYVRYFAKTKMLKAHFELHFDPEYLNDLKIEPVYPTHKINITTRYVPIGQLAHMFHSQMENVAKYIIPKFVFEEGKAFQYNSALVKLEIKGWNGVKNLDKHARFQVTNLVGVRVVDSESGNIVTYVQEGSSLFDVRDKVIEEMYREGR